MAGRIYSHRDLRVYQQALDLMLLVEDYTFRFPKDERYRSIDQILRSSSSVCANIGEAWRKRRYKAAFIAKLSDSEAEAAETQVWAEISLKRKFVTEKQGEDLIEAYEQVIRQLVNMIDHADEWVIKSSKKSPQPPKENEDLPA